MSLDKWPLGLSVASSIDRPLISVTAPALRFPSLPCFLISFELSGDFFVLVTELLATTSISFWFRDGVADRDGDDDDEVAAGAMCN